MRKRLFNSIQDMKGKIRVFCRVRPMLDFEEARGQNIAISIPDVFTAEHFWKDDKKAREYQLDQVWKVPLLVLQRIPVQYRMKRLPSSLLTCTVPSGIRR